MPINPEHSTRIAPRSVSRFYQDVDERGTTPVYHFSSEFRSKEMVNAAVEGISHAFPVRGRHYTLEVDNVHGESRSVSEQEEKDAVINSKSILVPIKGDVKLVQNSTGKVVSEARDYPLAKCPIATNRNTYILEGNNYSISHQLVLRPGAYVREDDNGDLETHFNTGSGQSFRLTMDPKSMLFYIVPRPGSSKYLLIPVLAALGVAGQLEGLMGKEVLHANLVASSGQEEKVITGLFSKIAPREMQATHPNFSEMKGLLPEIFSGMSLDPKTTRITLGAEHEHVNAQALLASLAKMIAVYKGEQEQDNRDSLSFKKVVRPPDMIVNRFVKGRNTVASKLKNSLIFRLDNAKEYNVRSVLPANYFTKVITNFFQTSSLAYNPTETNPMDNVENMGKVTSLGEGGIEDENQIPLSARALDPSHFSVLDLVRTPESSHAGVDVRFGVNTTLGKNGEIYQQLYNKEGKSVKMATYRSAEYVIGFPEEKRGDKVLAVDHGKMALVDPKKVDFWYGEADNFFGPLTSLIPFANSDHPNRLVMAGKALPQALSLVKREVPLVQTMSQDNIPYSFKWGHPYSKKAKEEGVVLEVSPDHIKTTAETIPLVHNIPFNQKGFVDYTPSVSVGDKVRRGTVVADSNYTKNGFLALGKNLRVAYMPYKGFNFEDGIVISQAAAEQMTSQHMYVEKATLGRSVTTDLRLLKKYYKDKFQPSQLQGLDSKGFPVVGRVLHKGDPIFVFFEKREPTAEEKMLGRLHKSLLKPYGIITEYWAHDEPGTVVEVGYHNYNLRVVIRTESAATVGDKLTGLHGNKGVITKVLPDEMMPHDTHGTKMDLLLNPAGVTSRVNLGQLMETAAGKIAEHDKEFYRIHPFKTGDNLKTIKAELAKRGLSDRDVLINPETGKPFESPVFTGKQYIIKLNKTADSGYSARGEGPTYDREGQPKKGGLEGAKKIGFMEWLGLLASDARHNLREMGTIKSEKGEHWGKFVEGTALPLPQMTFATQKFLHSLTGAGIHVKEGDGKWKATPLTNAEILRASKGEIQNPGMLRAKDLEPEKGGLFDTVLTGGRQGERFNHFTLAEPVLNPALETSVQNLLGLTQVQMRHLISGEYYVTKDGHNFTIRDKEGKAIKEVTSSEEEDLEEDLEKDASDSVQHRGGEALRHLLDFNVEDRKKKHLEEFRAARTKYAKDAAMKKLRVLHGFHNAGIDNPSHHVLLNYVPVVPSRERTILEKSDGSIEYGDVNLLYRDSMLVNNGLKELKKELPDEDLTKERGELYESVKAIQGYGDPISRATKERGVKGFAKTIHGNSPKTGYFQNRLLSKKQDFSGRLVLSENPGLAIDEAEVPEDFLWTTYKTHLLRALVKRGYSYVDAEKAIAKRTPAARDVMAQEAKRVPIIVNRNPTLLKSNLIALKPIPSDTHTLNINPLTFKGLAADVDGDQVNIYVPMTPQAVEEAKEKLSPRNNLMDFRNGAGGGAFTSPSHEAVLGAHYLTTPDMNKKVLKFSSREAVITALKNHEITPDTPVEVS